LATLTALREATPETHARPHQGTGLVAPAGPTTLRKPRRACADRTAVGKPHTLRWLHAGGSEGGWAAMPCRGRGQRRDQGRAGPERQGVGLAARRGPPQQRAASRVREQGALGAASSASASRRGRAKATAGKQATRALVGRAQAVARREPGRDRLGALAKGAARAPPGPLRVRWAAPRRASSDRAPRRAPVARREPHRGRHGRASGGDGWLGRDAACRAERTCPRRGWSRGGWPPCCRE
jgi:hypothetical protein